MTGNVERFVKKLNMRNKRIKSKMLIDESYVLITYTTRFGEVPKSTSDFLEENHHHLKGVSSSGNRNWGLNFGRAADIISKEYGVPLLLKFELSGLENDVGLFIERLREFETY